MQTKRISILTLLVLLVLRSGALLGQIKLYLNIDTYDNRPLEGTELLVQEGDSVVQFSVIKTPQYLLQLPKEGLYNIQLANPHYETFKVEATFTADTLLSITLAKPAVALDEVIVVGKAKPKVTATGEIFKLSKKAKASGDPFRALSEIPLLQVDISSQSIKMRTGESPLILVDGHLVNSGVQPIHPENIESVEVTEVVSARYLQMGVTKIVNIRLREVIPLYSYIEMRTRNDIPLREGFGGANFELGKKKFAVAGNLFGDYLTKDRTRYQTIEQLAEQKKEIAGTSTSQAKGLEGYLLLKWLPTPSDYLSAVVKYKNSKQSSEGTLEGTYTLPSRTMDLKTSNNSFTTDGGWLAALYHEHTFDKERTLSTYLKYNRGFYDNKQNYLEYYNENVTSHLLDLVSLRDQYTLSIDYDSGEQSFGTIALGNNLEYTRDAITNQTTTPSLLAHVGLWSNYTHATYSNHWKQLHYMASLGLQSLAVKAADKQHAYWRPRAALSLAYRLPHAQSIRGSYYLTNQLPASNTLVSFNQSTNPWIREEGNPFLMPMQIHQFELKYNCSFGNFRLWLFGDHNRRSKVIEPYIRQEGAYQVKSFRNNGTYTSSDGGFGIHYSSENFQASASTGYTSEVFNGQDPKGSFGVKGYFRWDFGDFFIYSSLAWRNRSYSAISQTTYKNPIESHIQIAWQVNKRLYLSLGLPYFWGTRSHVTGIDQAQYKSQQQVFYESASLRPWLLISWTLRKNAKSAIPQKMPGI